MQMPVFSHRSNCVFRMKLEVILWIHIFLSLSRLSTCANQNSILGGADGIPSLTIPVSLPAPSQDTMTTHLTSLTPPSITLATATTQLASTTSSLTQDTVIIRPTLDTGSSSSGMPTITFATLPSSTVTLTIAVPSLKPQVTTESTIEIQSSTSSLGPSVTDSSTVAETSSDTQEPSTVSTSITLESSTISESLVTQDPSAVPASSTSQISSTVSGSPIVLDTSSVFVTSSSVSVATSSVVLTTPPASLNASTAGEVYWIETVLKVSTTVDVSAESFKTDLERRLAEAFEEAFIREKLIAEGRFESLRRRKRKKRFTQAGDAAVHIHRITREPESTTVSTAYSVEKSGSVLQPAAAVNALNTLETQELAIILSQVVQSKAEPYIKTETPPQPPGEESKLWIIAAVAGPIVAVVLLVWIVLCIYLKCCRAKTPLQDLEEEGAEPELTSIRKPDTKEASQFSKGKDNPAYSELPRQSSRPAFKKGRTYEVNPLPDPDFIKGTKELEQTPLTTPEKKQNRPSTSIQNGSAVKDTSPKQTELDSTPQKKKRTKRRNDSVDPLGLSSPGNTARTSNSDQSNLLSSISGDDDELKLRTETERKKNKDRLREKHQKKKDADVRAYLESQREIDQVLGVPNGLPDVFVEESGSPSHAKVSRQDSGVSNEPLSGEETLEEARKRMHQLLDDAFTLISPRASFHENDLRHRDKVSPMSTPDTSKVDSSTNSKSKISTVHLDSTKDLGKHIKHEPMHFDSGYSYKDFPLETWSPYRASDQVALISMPNKVDTKLGGPKKKNAEKERPATSKASRRPAANFEVQESKSAGNLDTKYTSSSPQPIVLRTKDLAGLVNANTDNRPKEVTKTRENANGKYAMTSINGDVYLTGSTTSLSKQKNKSIPNAGGLEMHPMKSKGWTSLQKHRAPVPNVKDKDEVDVINNIKENETSDDLIKSLRDELQYLKGNFNVDSKSSKKGGRTSGKSMTEIV